MGDASRTAGPRRARGGLWLVLALLGWAGACTSVPAYLSMEAEELWSTGIAAYDREDWDEAIERLERFVVVSPTDTRAPEARIRVARAYAGRGEYLTAASEFEQRGKPCELQFELRDFGRGHMWLHGPLHSP